MNLLKTKALLIFIIVLTVTIPTIGKTVSVPINATATVIPAIGVMSIIEQSQSFSISESHNSKLLVQVPKNSTLLIHIQNTDKVFRNIELLTNELSSTLKSSVSDLYMFDLSGENPSQTVTIITVDN